MGKETLLETLRAGRNEETTVQTIATRGVAEVQPTVGLEENLQEKRLSVYLGIDPTAPELHIGHGVPLIKLRQLQELGHKVHLLFGTFTGMIGDPTDKSAARVRLTPEDIQRNIATYSEQAGKILDLSPDAQNPIAIVHNHEWLGTLNFADIVDLAANFTVQQMSVRRMFQDRMEADQPVYLHEFLYPLMQGYDSVAMDIDVEVGGKDQLFNMLIGRDLVARYLNKDKWCVATKLIENPVTGRKMGKTEGNVVAILDWPEIKYEAIMTWPDEAISLGFELLTRVPMEEVVLMDAMIKSGELNPIDAKKALAYRVVAELDSLEDAEYATEEFDRVFKQKLEPRRMKEAVAEVGMSVLDLLVKTGLSKDEGEATALARSGSIFLGGKQIKPSYKLSDLDSEATLQVGKKSLAKRRKITLG